MSQLFSNIYKLILVFSNISKLKNEVYTKYLTRSAEGLAITWGDRERSGRR
jgi:hypothetical protein